MQYPQNHSHRKTIASLIARGAIIMVVATSASVGLVACISADLPPDLYRRSIWAALILPMIISPPISFMVGRLNYRYFLLHHEVERMANFDELTGLTNRRAFRVAAEARLARETTEPVLLLLADIDRFKGVNDTHGHGAGDAALAHVAHLLAEVAPEGAEVARLGGDEFVILTEWTSLADARRLADALCHRVAETACPGKDGAIPLTISLGLTLGSRSEDLSAILRRADDELYLAKNNGRNRYSVAA